MSFIFASIFLLFFKSMGLSGLEPPTSRLSGVRSNQLSHWAILQFSEGYVPSKLHTAKTNIIIQTYHCFGYALDLLVTVSSMCYHTSTSVLSTL